MRVIVGFGNELRAEDGFGVEVVKKLQSVPLKDTKLICCFQLTPELCLELLDATKVIFVDAAFSNSDHYALATLLENKQIKNIHNLSHHISANTIIAFLEQLYNHKPLFEIFSLLTNSFDEIKNKKLYDQKIVEVVDFLKR